MFRKVLNITILLAILSIYVFTPLSVVSPVKAVSCPVYMDDYECLDYLEEQAGDLGDAKKDLEEGIDLEQDAQGTLNQQIAYLNAIIAASENSISSLEVDIETKTVEIRILGKDIAETQNKIDLMSQEIDVLQGSVDKRVTLAYKYSFINPIELFLESENFESLLRRMKYLSETRKKDREILAEMDAKLALLTDQEVVLSTQKSELEKKRVEIEAQKTELFAEKEILDKKRAELADLLYISRQKEEDLSGDLENVEAELSAALAQITKLIIELFQSGTITANTPVNKGDVIGFQGHTGLSYGSHLHFELAKNGVRQNPYAIGWFTYPNISAAARFPETNATITQWPHNGYYAIDMVGGWSSDKYYTPGVSCRWGYVPAGWYGLNGEGAPVRAVEDGFVTAVLTDSCGGRYVLIDHGGGWTSMYLHLRD